MLFNRPDTSRNSNGSQLCRFECILPNASDATGNRKGMQLCRTKERKVSNRLKSGTCFKYYGIQLISRGLAERLISNIGNTGMNSKFFQNGNITERITSNTGAGTGNCICCTITTTSTNVFTRILYQTSFVVIK